MSEDQEPVATEALLPATEEESYMHSLLVVLGKTLFAGLPISGIVLGAVYLDQCPRQPLVPIYLMLLSIVVLLLLGLSCVPCGNGTDQQSALTRHLRAVTLLFLCAWFIAGSVWVYSIYPPDYESVGQPSFCHRTLFLFAFGVTTTLHVALALALLLALSILVGIFIFKAVLPYGGHGSRGGP
ncbi:transmembrane protein 272-like isoform X2 [Pogona vitticeps]